LDFTPLRYAFCTGWVYTHARTHARTVYARALGLRTLRLRFIVPHFTFTICLITGWLYALATLPVCRLPGCRFSSPARRAGWVRVLLVYSMVARFACSRLRVARRLYRTRNSRALHAALCAHCVSGCSSADSHRFVLGYRARSRLPFTRLRCLLPRWLLLPPPRCSRAHAHSRCWIPPRWIRAVTPIPRRMVWIGSVTVLRGCARYAHQFQFCASSWLLRTHTVWRYAIPVRLVCVLHPTRYTRIAFAPRVYRFCSLIGSDSR